MSTRLSEREFDACADAFDARVESESGIDPFCSGSAWILPFHRAFVPDRELHLHRDGDAFVALAARTAPGIGLYLEPLETMWQYPCPVVGPGGARLLGAAQRSAASAVGARDVPVVLSGVPMDAALARAIAGALRGHELRVVGATLRWIASLEGGLDGWLGRRSASARRNLRSAARRAERAGLAFEHVRATDADRARALYARILAIERTSWKSRTGVGVADGPMCAFYADMLPRLAARDRLRVLFAKVADRDVGYLHGGVSGRHFRGLQMSFDAAYARLSIGNLLQLEMIATLCAEGFLSYDLGSAPGYKERWAEPGLRTATVVCRPVV